MERRNINELAWRVILEGKTYSRDVTCEGSADSGPYGLKYTGKRIGKLKVELAENGNVRMCVEG